ncbi:MAG: hypothetical protein HYX51_10745 [Chloroflexi bacterium]|nr:hypothetical protein [Chloroflexota bacterium]
MRNESDQVTTVTFTGSELTVAAPQGSLVQFLSGCDGPLANPSTCSASAHTIMVCQQGGGTAMCVIRFTTVPAAGMTETVALVGGCNNVTLTWQDGTPLAMVAGAIEPPAALLSIWRFDNAAQRFSGYSPLPAAPNDLTTARRLDAVFICMTGPGGLTRPVISS